MIMDDLIMIRYYKLAYYNFVKQSKAKQSKACIVSLTNNLNFYILQFFKALYFFFYKENESSCSFFYREKRTTLTVGSSQKAISFLSKKKQAKARRAKTTPFRIRNSLIKIFLQYLESLSLRGFAEAIYSIVDCFITFAHAVRLTLCALATAMTIKNNLVKTFLTSITFDSLSRKIKNPCLVIKKKFIPKGDF